MGSCTAAALSNPQKRNRDNINNVPPCELEAKRPKLLGITINTSDDDLDLLSGGKKSTEDRILDDEDIAYWLNQQSRKSATAGVLRAVNELAKGLEATPGSKSTLLVRTEASMPTNETLSGKTALQPNSAQASDVPYILRGLGAFADDASTIPADLTTTGRRKRRPWMRKNRRPIVGWDQLWL
ncbi:hypothetical protein CKAH01_03182 [Colletotrichum kahawae]|uniref:Uncharacterized protein n=1 Tax=Colletotrichum kahawae TaxID=34407 RepID=A0AAE0DDG8_COLKA|nr:hypothetical protein CKAH01_03182 [Colletotrichum kahawae]